MERYGLAKPASTGGIDPVGVFARTPHRHDDGVLNES